ncbi:MAG: Gfo/Idh/MocA family protein [Burkholderiaceae bacterium]
MPAARAHSPHSPTHAARPFGLAIVGAGLAAAPHLAALLELRERIAVHHVVGRSSTRAEALAGRLPHADTGTDLDRALSDPRVDGVLLLTPPDTHLTLGSRIAAAGRHLLVEKPVELTVQRARELLQVCESHGVVAATVLQHRARPAATRLAQLLRDEALGPLHGASIMVPWWRPQSYYDEPGRGTLARDGGGVLMTQAIHTLDLYVWLTGMPQQVFARALTSSAHRMECEDTVAGVLMHGGGRVASLFASTAAPPGFPDRIELYGPRGSALLSAGRLELRLADGTRLDTGDAEAVGSGADPMAFSHHAHRAILANFADAAHGRATPIAPMRDAIGVQSLIEALIASSRSGASQLIESETRRG